MTGVRQAFQRPPVKWVIQTLIDMALFAGFVMLLLHTVLQPQGRELGLLIRKYTATNLSQNTGLHQKALVLIQLGSNLLPQFKTLPLHRQPNQVGTRAYNPLSAVDPAFIRQTVTVKTPGSLLSALKDAKPGTLVMVEPGIYPLKGKYKSFPVSREGGLIDAPIIVAARSFGRVVLDMTSLEGFLINSPNWHFENLIFRGRDDRNAWNEHAVHLAGNADNITFINNAFINFNAAIKSNGLQQGKRGEAFPDRVNIINNNFYNESKRDTRSPVVPLDVVGGDYWQVRDNFFADFGQSGHRGVGITYGLYLKGGSRYAKITNNLIACEWRVPHTTAKDMRMGLSLGGGGTGDAYCPGGRCAYEHLGGSIAGNRILNCQNDVGISLNRAADTLLTGNQVLGSLGIEVKNPESSVTLRNNEIYGRIIRRRGGRVLSDDD